MKTIRNDRGVTLIELAVVIGLGSILMLGASSVVYNTIQNQNTLEIMTEANQISDIVREALMKKSQCTANFKGIKLKVIGGVIQSTEIPNQMYYASGETLLKSAGNTPFLNAVAVPNQSTPIRTPAAAVDVFTKPILRYNRMLNADVALFYLDLQFQINKSPNMVGGLKTRSIPVALKVSPDDPLPSGNPPDKANTMYITGCENQTGDTLSTRETICKTLSGGTRKWNKTTESCEDTLVYVEGTAFDVTCPAGTKLAPATMGKACSVTNRPSAPPSSIITYPNGDIGEPMTYDAQPNTIASCHCVYMAGVDTSASKCKAACSSVQ